MFLISIERSATLRVVWISALSELTSVTGCSPSRAEVMMACGVVSGWDELSGGYGFARMNTGSRVHVAEGARGGRWKIGNSR